jgi:glutathione synthase/RimK-type ligase-like ATP-grasp enzyme
MPSPRSLAVFYEHPHWFNPLFTELERRGIAYRKIDAASHRFDPAESFNGNGGPPLLFNRMSPSAWKRGRGGAIFYTLHYLHYLESLGAPVVNGSAVFTLEVSKALQVALLRRLGLPVPRTVVVNHPSRLPAAAEALSFPLLVKPNVGGSGAGIIRFDDLDSLKSAAESLPIDPGLDGTLLLQECHPPRGRSIVRVETLAGRYLYGIRVHLDSGAGFDLCPADICKTPEGVALESSACPVGAAKAGLTVERFDPPEEIIAAVERIARAAHLDVGGIEYLESERDGRLYFYDINALSNFVADPQRVIGFDPTSRLVDYLEERCSGRRS